MLTQEFLSTYPDFPQHMGDLGRFVFLRTYARWIGTGRETFKQMVQRVVEYSCSLAQVEDNEPEELFDAIFNMRLFPAGRSMWIGGTKSAATTPLANFNCSFRVIDSFDAMVEGFYLLMVGAGFGFRVLPKDVESIPAINSDIVLSNKPYNPKEPYERREDTVSFEGDGTYLIVVGDSKQGWVNALAEYFKAMQRDDIESISINYDSVRPRGELLKTFGGRASGHGALRDIFKGIHKVLTKETEHVKEHSNRRFMKPINAMDIMNMIGYGVVVGGVRRTSEICLFDPNDQEILDAKIGLFDIGHKNYNKTWRFMSNNSVYFTDKPTRAYLDTIKDRIRTSYEPGFINADEGLNRRANFNGVNPCAEILLDSKGVCNLSEVNVLAFVRKDGSFDRVGFENAVRLATRIGVRMTMVDLELPSWDEVQKRDRLTGVSLTGIMDALDASKDLRDMKSAILESASLHAQETATQYAYDLRIPIPLLVTCVKPSGTVSQLPTVSSGVHRSFAPFYIRRVRITSTDPLARIMFDLGYPIYPETNQGPNAQEFDKLSKGDQYAALEKANTWVVEFPVKTSAKVRASEETALDQYQRYLDFQHMWSDHNTSITVSVADDEWDSLFDRIHESWDHYVGVSFIAKDSNMYPLMPYEAITEQEYHTRALTVDATELYTLLQRKELEDLASELLEDDCIGGVCPVR